MPDKRTPVREQEPKQRIRNFEEVSFGYTESEAMLEAGRCLQCKAKPCVRGCPLGIDIPSFVKMIKDGNFESAVDKIMESNPFPRITGRVCPQEKQCEMECTLGKLGEPINIGKLERFVSDRKKIKPIKIQIKNKGKVAVIGSGPAGLTCAVELVKNGYSVTVFEALHKAGGVLAYGIPEFRLPKKIVDEELWQIKKFGVRLKLDVAIGQTISLQDLLDGFDAVFIGSGAGLPSFMGIPGENLNEVYSANEFLTRVNLMSAYKGYDTPICIGNTVATIGAGNVAIDCARTALRLGAKNSYVIYRRSEEEAPARKEEITHAKEEGVEFIFMALPVRIIGDEKGSVKEIECLKTKFTKPDSRGRREVCIIDDSNFSLKVDTVIVAIGQKPNPLIPKTTPELKTSGNGIIVVDENYMTSVPRVFAGGDITSGAATVILAMNAGKNAAKSIDRYLSQKIQGNKKKRRAPKP